MNDCKTVFVTLCDRNYFGKARRTIIDLRSRGEWHGDIVLVTVDFPDPSVNFLKYYNIIHKPIQHINTDKLMEQLNANPIRGTCDDRQNKKLVQWDKLFVFNDWFRQWDRVIFLDAGLRVLEKVSALLELEWRGKILSHDDTAPFKNIIDLEANSLITEKLFTDFSRDILERTHFLNCMWVYDTAILDICSYTELEEGMNKYPICTTNEMTIMNLYFTFKYNLWQPFPVYLSNGKQTFGWSEKVYGTEKTWHDFCFVKYPTTINFDCD